MNSPEFKHYQNRCYPIVLSRLSSFVGSFHHNLDAVLRSLCNTFWNSMVGRVLRARITSIASLRLQLMPFF